jgi:transcription antitermination protein NusB
MNPAARRHARQFALQAIYQWQIADTPVSEIETDFLTTHMTEVATTKIQPDQGYFLTLLRGVCSKHLTLDEIFSPFLNIPAKALDPVELAILRLSTFELAERPDVPWRVVINEALELAKTFGSIEGYKFVNGVLDRVARKLRADEIRSNKK